MHSHVQADIDHTVFDELSQEIRLVLGPNGEVLNLNHCGKRIFGEKTFSFFHYFEEEDRQQVFQFLKMLTSSQKEDERHSTFSFSRNNLRCDMTFKGKWDGHFIYLIGKMIEQKAEHIAQRNAGFNHLLSQNTNIFLNFLETKLDLAVILLREDDEIQFCNDRFGKYLQLEAQHITGSSVHALQTKHPLKDTLIEIVEEIRSTGLVNERYYYEDDALYQFQGLYFPEDEGILLLVHDRSYQQRFENLLIYKQQMESVSQLAAGVAHELRNPLSVIRGFLQLSSLTNDWTKYYNTILSELTRMNDIIEDFLSVSRKKIKKQKQLPHAIFQSLVYIIRSECLLHNITFEYHIEKTDAYVDVNEAMIKQVLLNLLRNTIEVYEEKKDNRRFVLHTKVMENRHYQIVIQDFGKGMEKEVLEQLGKPFFTTKEKGNGIGIPLCKKIVENHEGEFFVESELEKGTKITFTLPLTVDEGE
ncbi:two-component system sensor histidine kinase NtrB [Aureibacillus halotolerans]|uniref:histidine kinase n=1 Tax=Aureibacillus halotolerans TaxID=1508390 RepID=A0A4R6U7G5_9BACI|nr:ATP-binding protein [Aureibacillus halotolerans]TDQ41716.1 signal transduction histidine kinase [Aureibacillus halotolerans]